MYNSVENLKGIVIPLQALFLNLFRKFYLRNDLKSKKIRINFTVNIPP